jgi:hypothetical protein
MQWIDEILNFYPVDVEYFDQYRNTGGMKNLKY